MSTYHILGSMNAITAGHYLRGLRKAKNLNRAQLATELGLDYKRLERWEKGENRPGIDALSPLMERLGGSVEEFAHLWEHAPGTVDDAQAALDRTLGSAAKAVDAVADRMATSVSPSVLAEVIDLAQRLSEEDRQRWLDIGRRLRRGET